MRLIFLMVDTFRRDRLACYGNTQGLARELDKLAKDSVVFDNYYVSSFPTVPNPEDTLCGYYGFPHHGWGQLPDESVPMSEILREQGYLTQLITDTPHLIGRQLGYQRGFHAYHWIRGHAEETPELFNLREDPGQKKNVYREHKDVATKMGRAYVQFLESVDCETGKVALMAKKFQ